MPENTVDFVQFIVEVSVAPRHDWMVSWGGTKNEISIMQSMFTVCSK